MPRRIVLIFFIALAPAFAQAAVRIVVPPLKNFITRQQYPLLPAGREPWKFDEPIRLVAIGDIHGHHTGLIRILRGMNLIDDDLNWSGGETVLVTMGDAIGRGDRSRQVLDLLMKLEGQAAMAGGRVVALLGNHEYYFLNNEYNAVSIEDADQFTDLVDRESVSPEEHRLHALVHAGSPDSPYGAWLAARPAAVQFGRRLFIHAGIEGWIETGDIGRLNATIGAWLRHIQDKERVARPRAGTGWVLGASGPLMTRRLGKGAVAAEKLKGWLDKLGIDALVVGHTKVKGGPIVDHPVYGRGLIMLDTAIVNERDGVLSAVEFRPGEPPRPFVFERCEENLLSSRT